MRKPSNRGPGSGCNDHRFAGLGMADVDQAEIRRETDVAEHADRGRDWRERRIQPAQILALRCSIVLPAGIAGDDVTGAEVRIVRLLDAADGPAHHHFTDGDWCGVGFDVVHAPAHVGIDREVECADQYLARSWNWNR